jgi:hypothetical protein
MMEDIFFFFRLVVVVAILLGVLQIQWSGLQFPHFPMIESKNIVRRNIGAQESNKNKL